jgi:hypothetical protein
MHRNSRFRKIRGIGHPDLDTSRDVGISAIDIQETRVSRTQPNQLRDIAIVGDLGGFPGLQVQ